MDFQFSVNVTTVLKLIPFKILSYIIFLTPSGIPFTDLVVQNLIGRSYLHW